MTDPMVWPRQHTEVKLAGHPSLREVRDGPLLAGGLTRQGRGACDQYWSAAQPLPLLGPVVQLFGGVLKRFTAPVVDPRRGRAGAWASAIPSLVNHHRSASGVAPPPGGAGP